MSVPSEQHRLPAYLAFADRYDIQDVATFIRLYDIDELTCFLPATPTDEEKRVLNALIGVEGVTYGYLDWIKSNNTFELLMQWQEQTGRYVDR
ncbi:hypothetical protein SAMN05421823_102666 [Catalinimonas alkaloidigena]|uniref:Uncharacterized protein n=1 Tax=Catalinimonas alkaloidigena TaxID=1075417 RepID=A0A1G9BN80_9BACT|nr:hypothetical protein [Catalinimonas alkaloidigena]SDK40927.1 hypothetical protein SAMN05421823_102666 [Catalinimonas alkaloidigena]